MTANASAAMNDAGAVAARTSAAGRAGTYSAPPKGVRRGDAIRELKKRDNYTNFRPHRVRLPRHRRIGRGLTIWSYGAVAEAGLGWWWNIPMTLVAIAAVGASQHQFGGVIHEATHFILFENRTLNELASDWLAAFPIYTSHLPLPPASPRTSPVHQ